ncbi:MAG: hypothetical protein ABFS34_00615 [Gemmatimonadota bacterium]
MTRFVFQLFRSPTRTHTSRVAGLLGLAVLTIAGCEAAPPPADQGPELGEAAQVGAATATPYAEFDADGAPSAIGIALSENFFDELPREPSNLRYCWDRDEDGEVAQPDECIPTHDWVIPLPSAAAARADMPFKWALLNWNPLGHIPPGVYDSPHFDVHFYIEPVESIMGIEPGPCGPEFVNCDQFETGRKPLPANYMDPKYVNVDAVAPAMGNHLVDVSGPEFSGEPFTRAWIYGSYDGRVTFYEEMVSLAFLVAQPSECFPIDSPPAVAVAGYYPTSSCLRYVPETGDYTVSLEDFVLREASPPEAVPEQAAVTTAGE